MKKTYKTPDGKYYALYRDMLDQVHLLIAGATGSGKSVVINGLIATALYHSPAAAKFVFVDLKRVELTDYRHLPHTIRYAENINEALEALSYALTLSNTRYQQMQRKRLKKYDGGHIYVIIDEFAELMTTAKNKVTPLIQRLCQIGRAANIHVIAATQCPLAEIIPTKIKVNFDSRLGLRTSCARDSRNIIDMSGCESLPDPVIEHRAQGYYKHGSNIELWNLPKVPDDEIERLISYWKWHRFPKISLF